MITGDPQRQYDMGTHSTPTAQSIVSIRADGVQLGGLLGIPSGARGIVIFAHGSGSGRLSPRNNAVAGALRTAGIATLLLDLLTEEEATDRRLVFDIPFLARRLRAAADWVRTSAATRQLAIGYFGASTGGGAALVAAADDEGIAAIVSRGGRPDLAGLALSRVEAPTLLIVGGNDGPVIGFNEWAYARLQCTKHLTIVPGAGHLFEEPGTLERVVELAIGWYRRHLEAPAAAGGAAMIFDDREDAGRQLAARLLRYKDQHPVVLALPRGGVPVAYEVARALEAPLDILVVRKLGAPGQPELGIGAIVDGDHPDGVLNENAIAALGVARAYLEDEIQRQLREIRRRQAAYRSGRPPVAIAGRTAIVIDDGLATGSTMRAALRGVRRAQPARLVLAVPVAPPDTLASLASEVDDVVCVSTPEDFGAVGRFYRNFDQTTDEEVVRLLDDARHTAAQARAAATT